MSSALNSFTQTGQPSGSGSLCNVTKPGRLGESLADEVDESLSGIIINISTCLRMLAADPPNLEGARETARRTIRDSMRAAEAISQLRTLLNETNPRMVTVAPFTEGSSTAPAGGRL
jgi:hypothetical protein